MDCVCAGITETPGILIVGDNNLKFLFEGYAMGTLEAHLKSEPMPESNDEHVYVLVGIEFEKVVGQDSDVFVEYYAP